MEKLDFCQLVLAVSSQLVQNIVVDLKPDEG